MLFSIFKTSGHSMLPKIKNGSFFIVSSIPIRISGLNKEDIVVFKNENKNIVKKIVKIENNLIFVEGENKSDSKKFRPIKKREVIGKVIWII